ncbi:MAG: N-acetylmuramoyl-L-alanine amidase [Sarcina sp.]
MKIAINPGHTIKGKGTGAFGIVSETVENRKIANKVMALLEERGVEVINCTFDESENDLKEVVEKANKNNVDVFISIHLNAGGGNGTETYIYRNGGKAEILAKKINNLVYKSCSFKNRGIKEANFYVLKNTIAPAILLEVCFVDSKEDTEKLNVDLVAKAIVEGLIEDELIEIYRVRKNWDNAKSQIGAFKNLDNAKKVIEENDGYYIFNSNGVKIY